MNDVIVNPMRPKQVERETELSRERAKGQSSKFQFLGYVRFLWTICLHFFH